MKKKFLQSEMHSNTLRYGGNLSKSQTKSQVPQEELKCLEFQKHKGLPCLVNTFSVDLRKLGLFLWSLGPLSIGKVCQVLQKNCEVVQVCASNYLFST